MRRLKGEMLLLFLFIPVILSMTELFSAEQKKDQDGQRPVSFSQDIQPLFTKNCAVPDCHSGPKPRKGLVLDQGMAYQNLVDIPSKESPRQKRVASGDLSKSYLYDKVTGNQNDGDRMPPKKRLSKEDIELIKAWILAGAPGDSTVAPKDSLSVKENQKSGNSKN